MYLNMIVYISGKASVSVYGLNAFRNNCHILMIIYTEIKPD